MTKSYKLLRTGCLIVLVLIFYSCEKDYLEREPKGALSESQLATEAGVNGVLIGAYSLLNNGGTAGGDWISGKWIYGGVTSDDAHTGTEATALQPVPMYESYSWTPVTGGLNERWMVLYAGIQRANDALRLLPTVVESGEITTESATQIEAEAKFLRGLYHLEATLMWRNIPYIDETISASAVNFYVPNPSAVWAEIETDFSFAADNLTETKSEVGRANSWAAKAFLAKTYMFQQKFSEVKPLLTDIINNGVTSNGLKYDLNDNYFDNFRASTKHGPEQVFAVMHSVNDGAGGANGNLPSGDGNAGPYGGPFPSYGFYQPSFWLVNSYKTDPDSGLPLLDGSWKESMMTHDLGIPSSASFTPYQGTLDSRLDWIVGRRGIPFLDWGINPGQSWVRQQNVGGPYLHMKSANWQSETDAREGNSSANSYNMIRFADVLLWAAEVEVEVGELSVAEEYVNRVRQRAANPDGWVKTYLNENDPLAGFTTTPAANYKVGLYTGQFSANGQEFARRAVRFERKLELAMEHHRFFDLQRYNSMDGTGFMADLLNEYVEYELNVPEYNFFYMVDAEFEVGRHEIFPIPQAQIDLSKTDGEYTLEQNSSY